MDYEDAVDNWEAMNKILKDKGFLTITRDDLPEIDDIYNAISQSRIKFTFETEFMIYAALCSVLLQDDNDLTLEFSVFNADKSYNNDAQRDLTRMMENRYLFLRVCAPAFAIINSNLPQNYNVSLNTLDRTYFDEINSIQDVSQRKEFYEKLCAVATTYFGTGFFKQFAKFSK